MDRVALQRVGNDVAHVVALGEEELEARRTARHHLVQAIGCELNVGFHDHFTGIQVNDVGSCDCAIELGGFNLDLLDIRRANRLQCVRRDLAAGVRDLFALVENGVRRLRALQMSGRLGIGRNRPLQLAIGNVNPIDGIEGLENLFVRAQAQGAKEDGSEELALAVDANVKRVLLVVLELHPGSAIGNDLSQEIGAVVRRLEKHTR